MQDLGGVDDTIKTSAALADVRYEIRGQLAHRAHELERLGYEIVSLNIGNPGLFGFRTPETMRLAMIENYQSNCTGIIQIRDLFVRVLSEILEYSADS